MRCKMGNGASCVWVVFLMSSLEFGGGGATAGEQGKCSQKSGGATSEQHMFTNACKENNKGLLFLWEI